MRELRLLPAALVSWLVVLSVILTRDLWVGLVLILCTALIAGVVREPGQVVVLSAVGAATGGVAWGRIQGARGFELSGVVDGTVVSAKKLGEGLSIVRLDVEGYPASVPVMLRSGQEVPRAARVMVDGRVMENDRPGIGEILISATELEVLQEAGGYAGWVNRVRDSFADEVFHHVGPSSRGLIPGMVLGDTRMQDAAEEQIYIDTGLSHLSAVSGSNVSIATTSVMVMLALFTVGPRIQLAGAGIALMVFVSVVGTEPSVLRAAVTGTVGLLAVINSRRMEPIHGLCLAVIGLLLWDSDLAVQYGFILSVMATAGIVMLFPLLYRALAPTRWPDILLRALAVAIAADVVTMPIIAVMTGRISVVAVVANVLAAPAVAPVTVVGLIAVIVTLLPGGLEVIPLKLVEPFTWWIHHVAEFCHGLPVATVDTGGGWLGTIWVITACCWLIVGIHQGWVKLMGLAFLIILGMHWHSNRLPPVVDLETVGYVVVDKLPDAVPPGTGLIIVTDSGGEPADRPTATRDGVPVMFPNRDGEVSLHVDGSQHAADGRF